MPTSELLTTDQIIQLGILIAMIVGFVPLYVDLWQRRRNQEPLFMLQRFKEHTTQPIESEWSIRIFGTQRAIERCTIAYQTECCPWWDSEKEPYFERFIVKGGAGNVRIPKGATSEKHIVEWGDEVLVMDGDTILKRINLGDIPISQH